MNDYRKFYLKNLDAFFPEVFILPEENNAYIQTHKKHRRRTYISKSSSGSQGYGIKILRKPSQLNLDHYNDKFND